MKKKFLAYSDGPILLNASDSYVETNLLIDHHYLQESCSILTAFEEIGNEHKFPCITLNKVLFDDVIF